MLPDASSRRPTARRTRAWTGLVLVLGLAGCATPPLSPPATPGLGHAGGPAPAPAATAPGPLPDPARLPEANPPGERAADTQSRGAAAQTAAPPSRISDPVDPADARALLPLLAYAERLRSLGAAEITAEIASLGEPGSRPLGQMQLALALAHTHQPADTARALALLQRVAAMDSTIGGPYKPLARLLAGRLLDQRRLEDALERQTQQVREQQRRIEQLTDRLEAMRAIERSLNRPGSPTGNRGRSTPAP